MMNEKIDKNLIASYSDYEVIADEVKYYMERLGSDEPSPEDNERYLDDEGKPITDEDELFSLVAEDSTLFEMAFECLFDSIQEAMNNIMKRYKTKGYWLAQGSNLTWRNLSGEQIIYTKEAKELVNKITPNCDFSIKVYKIKGGLNFIVSHHDCPMGSSIDVFHLNAKEVKEYENN
jgi:hypothetical protein